MSAIYVMAGEERVGPLTTWELMEKVASGEFSPDLFAWKEGMEDWCAVGQILELEAPEPEDSVVAVPEFPDSGDPDSEDAEEVSGVLLEGPGYLLSQGSLQVGPDLFPMHALLKAEVEIEHTRRGKAIAWSIVFGVLTILTLAMPLRPETTNHWVLWSITLVVFLLGFVRCLMGAFRPTPAFVAIHLTNGDDRILPMRRKMAIETAKVVNEAIARFADRE